MMLAPLRDVRRQQCVKYPPVIWMPQMQELMRNHIILKSWLKF